MLKAGWIAPGNPFAERDPSALLERIMTETVDQDPLLCPGFAVRLIDIDKVDARRLSIFRERVEVMEERVRPRTPSDAVGDLSGRRPPDLLD
ncbi:MULTISPECIES: hypothetical protein [Rhizobium]|uniref:Uncharacterized protein n=1 Tax=Rhizobium favelukesii TaxID=348824 RepID=W6RDS5_9HYPH|nr:MULTISPECIES: hypothetical protein [Rhizobium]MCS0463721.1 hypothetical protein [Rhizobium favelukesii]UFS81449.1 hypothetical protein LPB79_24535 [Rhizobium sp. T136]CDM56848.1 hypothetical protein LPU83_1174 [Rhizobium favelukesii]